MKEEPYCVIGVIDSYGAIHHHPICIGGECITHETLWPTITHKRWRFQLSEWQLENSVLSKENLTKEEGEIVTDFVGKHYKKPNWVLQGEEWDALGRPRSGKAYDKHCAKWDAIYKKSP